MSDGWIVCFPGGIITLVLTAASVSAATQGNWVAALVLSWVVIAGGVGALLASFFYCLGIANAKGKR